MSLADAYETCLQQGRDEMTQLCESFPTLRGVPGTSPWDQTTFAQWASGPAPSRAMRLAAAFVLSVWNGCTPEDGGWWNTSLGDEEYRAGRFDAVEAFGVWDSAHRSAFIAWCQEPFFP